MVISSGEIIEPKHVLRITMSNFTPSKSVTTDLQEQLQAIWGFSLSSNHSRQRFSFGKTACGGEWEIVGAVLDDVAGRFFRVLSTMYHC
jgi:hypothetical protein